MDSHLHFEGCLTLVDVASDNAPSGARGRKVILTRKAALEALPTLLGAAVNYEEGWNHHNPWQKCGMITTANLDGNKVMVAGYFFPQDFSELEKHCETDGLMGMSFEMGYAHVADLRASVWTLTQVSFTGAAILFRDKAAYKDTSFHLKRSFITTETSE